MAKESRLESSGLSAKDREFLRLLTEARKSAGVTQLGLSERLSRPQSFVSKYERGERRLDVVEFVEVAQAMGADPIGIIRALLAFSSERKARK
jgi:transcriptional regulator with XRE-family HTH domain